MAELDYAGRVALVTGAGGGIGRAAALCFAQAGAAVVCADIDEDAAAETARLLVAAGGRAEAIRVDVGEEASNEAMVAAALAAFGRLDAAFLNAGILRRGGLLATPPEVFDTVMAVNLRGVYLGLRAVVPALQRSGGGGIVVTSSAAGLKADPALFAYSVSKHALVGLVQAASSELAPLGIRVNAVCPGGVATAMSGTHPPGSPLAQRHPLGRIGTPQEIAELVVFLAGPRAGFITGAAVPVDGGLTAVVAPRYLGT